MILPNVSITNPKLIVNLLTCERVEGHDSV